MFICEITTTEVNFCFYKQYSQTATRLICKRTIFAQNARIVCFFALIFLYTLKKISCKNYARLWKWSLKRTLQSSQNSLSRKSNLTFCIHNFIRQRSRISKDQASMFTSHVDYFILKTKLIDREIFPYFLSLLTMIMVI